MSTLYAKKQTARTNPILATPIVEPVYWVHGNDGPPQSARGIEATVALAEAMIKDYPLAFQATTIWDANTVVIGVVSDDANGLTVHKLAGWPIG